MMEKAACRSCHNPDGVASATRLHFPEPDAAPEKIEAFGRSLVTLVDRETPDTSLLLNKPTNRIPHAGGERIKPGSQDEDDPEGVDSETDAAFRRRTGAGAEISRGRELRVPGRRRRRPTCGG